MSKSRETAWRVFSSELNSATAEIKATEEMMPSYQISRLGAVINRVLIAGVLTEKENVGSDDEPMWRGRIQDISNGIVYINVGRFQPDAAAAMADLMPPTLVAVMGKVKSYTTDDQKTFVSVRPERIVPIGETVQREWLLDAARSTWERLLNMRKALGSPDRTPEGLVRAGIPEAVAKGIAMAIEQYEAPDSAVFLRSVQDALRTLLPDKGVDFGLPEDLSGSPDEIDVESGRQESTSASDDGAEETILRLLDELDTEGKGAARDELERRAEKKGISSMDLEEIANNLMDKGLVYEPNLRYLKRI